MSRSEKSRSNIDTLLEHLEKLLRLEPENDNQKSYLNREINLLLLKLESERKGIDE